MTLLLSYCLLAAPAQVMTRMLIVCRVDLRLAFGFREPLWNLKESDTNDCWHAVEKTRGPSDTTTGFCWFSGPGRIKMSTCRPIFSMDYQRTEVSSLPNWFQYREIVEPFPPVWLQIGCWRELFLDRDWCNKYVRLWFRIDLLDQQEEQACSPQFVRSCYYNYFFTYVTICDSRVQSAACRMK